jgi:hypothetical protein
MTAGQQIALVARFFLRHRGKLKSKYDVYMAVFYPSYVGQPPSTLFPENVRLANPGINTPEDYAAKVEAVAKLASGSAGGGALSLAPTPDTPSEPGALAKKKKRGGMSKRQYQRKVITYAALAAAVSLTALLFLNRELKRRIY